MPQSLTATRFSGGVNNLRDNDVFAALHAPDRTGYHEFLEDFNLFLATMWTVGGVGTPTRALAAGDGGLLAIGNSAASGDNSWVQGSIGYTIAAGKRLFFRARASVDDATLAAAVLGLQIAVAANNILTPVNGLFFLKAAAGTSMVLRNRTASATTDSASLGDVVAAQQFEVAFAYDGQTNVIAAAFQANTANGPAPIVATLTVPTLPSVALGVVAGVQNGSAVARSMSLDQIYAAKQR